MRWLKATMITVCSLLIVLLFSTEASAAGILPDFPGLPIEELYYREILAEQPDGERLVAIFDRFFDGLKNFGPEIQFWDKDFKVDEIEAVIGALNKEYIGGIYDRFRYSVYQDTIYSISPKYFNAYSDEQMLASFITNSIELLDEAGINSDNVMSLSATEKAKRIHDVLINNVTYGSGSQYNQTAYSAIVDREAVCAGYTRAFQFLLAECGVESLFIPGSVDGGEHAWSIVKQDGKWYNIDVTWDDPIGGSLRYSYFNLSDSSLQIDHTPHEFVMGYPVADSDGWNPIPMLTGSLKTAGTATSNSSLRLIDYTVPANCGTVYWKWVIDGNENDGRPWYYGTAPVFRTDGCKEGQTIQLYMGTSDTRGYIKSEIYFFHIYDMVVSSDTSFVSSFTVGIDKEPNKLKLSFINEVRNWMPTVIASYDKNGAFIKAIVLTKAEDAYFISSDICEVRFFALSEYRPICDSFSIVV